MKFLFALISSSIMIIFFSYCQFQFQEIVDTPVSSKSQLAFHCELINGTSQSLPYITYTSNFNQSIKWDFSYLDSIFGNQFNSTFYFNPIDGASVEIFEDGKFFKKFDNKNPNNYHIDGVVKFNYGKEYTLKVFKEGYDSVIGKQTFPRDYLIDSNNIKLNKNNVIYSKYGGLKLSELVFEINDSIEEKNAYTFRVEINNSKTNDVVEHFAQQIPIYLIDKQAILSNVITDSFFNGQKYFWHVGISLDSNNFRRPFPPSPNQKLTIVVYFKSTSPDYILYIKRLQSGGGAASSSPYSEPTSPYFNMKGGAGLFTVSGQEYRIEIPVNY